MTAESLFGLILTSDLTLFPVRIAEKESRKPGRGEQEGEKTPWAAQKKRGAEKIAEKEAEKMPGRGGREGKKTPWAAQKKAAQKKAVQKKAQKTETGCKYASGGAVY